MTKHSLAFAAVAAAPFVMFACSKTTVDTSNTKPSQPVVDTANVAPPTPGATPAPQNDPGVAPLAPLNGGGPAPKNVPQLPPGTHTVRAPDGGVTVVNEAGAPVAMPPGFQIPSAWAIPTALPSGFPTALPSNIAFPTALPSGFQLPPMPGAAPTN